MVVHTVADGMVSGVVCVTVPLTDRLWCGCTHSSGWNGLWCCMCITVPLTDRLWCGCTHSSRWNGLWCCMCYCTFD